MKEKRSVKLLKSLEGRLDGVLASIGGDRSNRDLLDSVFDHSTLLGIYKLMNKGYIDSIEWPVARGKEGHVFRGEGVGGAVALKIFNTSNAIFRNLIQYIEGDPRFGALRRKHRHLVDIWVRKEYRNLHRMVNHGLRVPAPIAHHKNILVMEWLGDERAPAPRLQGMMPEKPEKIVEFLRQFILDSWVKAGLVHADLSEFNTLMVNGEPVVIDVGQAVSRRHPNAKTFLIRDIKRVAQWGEKMGVVVDEADILLDILEADAVAEVDGVDDAWEEE